MFQTSSDGIVVSLSYTFLGRFGKYMKFKRHKLSVSKFFSDERFDFYLPKSEGPQFPYSHDLAKFQQLVGLGSQIL